MRSFYLSLNSQQDLDYEESLIAANKRDECTRAHETRRRQEGSVRSSRVTCPLNLSCAGNFPALFSCAQIRDYSGNLAYLWATKASDFLSSQWRDFQPTEI